MDALRTAVVLVLLLALGYGVWVVLNHDGGVEDPPSFDWDAEMADGASGFGEGPFVPPAAGGEAATAGGPGFNFGSPAAGAETAAGPTMTPSSPYGAATTDNSAAVSRFAAKADEPNIPPPPPGFSAGGANDGSPNQDLTAGSNSGTVAEPPAPPTANGGASGSRYDGSSNLALGAAAPSESGVDSRYGGSTPIPPSTQDSNAIPSKSSPLAPESSTSSASLAPAASFRQVLDDAKKLRDEGESYEALYILSQRYGDPALSGDEQRELHSMLDPLAGKVIYSTEHLLEEAYVARGSDSLVAIAKQFNVPHQLLQNINAIENPEVLTPGTELKVVRGPFRAEINLAGSELTLFLGPLYAGRFPISVGAEPSPAPGEYTVRSKEAGKAYFGPNGASFPADHPSNPYGRYWIDLGNQICIHGAPSEGDGRGMGCVSLSPVDAADVFGILSAGSEVVIRR